MPAKISLTTNNVYIRRRAPLLRTDQNHRSDHWCVYTSSTCYAKNHVFVFPWPEEKNANFLDLLIYYCHLKWKILQQEKTDKSEYLHCFIVYNVWNWSKHGAGQNPGCEGQCLHWYRLSFLFPCWRRKTTQRFWVLDFFSVGGIGCNKCRPIFGSVFVLSVTLARWRELSMTSIF